jgi:pantoate--beta-alanine ligase
MQIFREIPHLKAFLTSKKLLGKSIGLVPTMGALHQGHLGLIRNSKNETDLTVCSIFVNPTQFNNPADLQKYPRTLEADISLLEKEECDVLFCPEASEMYPEKSMVSFSFGELDTVMEGKFRPGHFSGVALVVSKLFHIVEPHTAFFGQKDWQQFAVIRHLVNHLNFNTRLKSVSTFREADGLAMSSRNLRLTASQRTQARVLFEALTIAHDLLESGESIVNVKIAIKSKMESHPEVTLEYFEIADSENLTLLNSVDESNKPILCIAAYVGEVRLIDNMFYN